MLFTAEVIVIDQARRRVDLRFPDGSIRSNVPYTGLTPDPTDSETILAVCGNIQDEEGAIICLGFTLNDRDTALGTDLGWVEINTSELQAIGDDVTAPQDLANTHARLAAAVRECLNAFDNVNEATMAVAEEAGAGETIRDAIWTLSKVLMLETLQFERPIRSVRAIGEVQQLYLPDQRPTEGVIREAAKTLGVVVTYAKDGAEEWALINLDLMRAQRRKR